MLSLAGLAGFGLVGRGAPATTSEAERTAWSAKLGNRLFLPALIIPLTALIGTLAYNYTPLGAAGWIEPSARRTCSSRSGVLLALAATFVWLRPPPLAPVEEGRRLLDAIGWAAVLPQMLAALGAVFAIAGVGDAVGTIARAAIPEGSVVLTVACSRSAWRRFDGDGQRLRRVPGDGRGDRGAAADRRLRRRSRGDRAVGMSPGSAAR